MTVYRYRAIDHLGKKIEGIIHASSVSNARRTLQKKKIYIRSLVQDREKKERELFPLLGKILYRVKKQELGLWARRLGTLLEAGLSLEESLSNVIEQTENIILKKKLIQIRADVLEGISFSKAIARHEEIFPVIYIQLISVAENTGKYEDSLLRLAEVTEKSEEIEKKITNAMTYPLIMLFLLGGIMVFLLTIVFPRIKELFLEVNVQLPLLTRVLLGVSDFLTSYWLFVFLGFVGLSIHIFRKWKNQPIGRNKWEKFIFKLPVIGKMSRQSLLARFSRNFAVLLENNVPLLTSMMLMTQIIDHQTFAREISIARDNVKEGISFSRSFAESTIMSQMLIGMITAGEAADAMPKMMGKAADVMERDLASELERATTLIEPVMMVVLALIIILMMVGILSPMYELTQQLQY